MELEVKCRHCGKDITLLDPRQWGYRKKDKKGGWVYYCTWKCLRADEKQNERPEHIPQKREYRERLKVLEDMIDAAGQGRNVYDYLREQGYKEPKDTLRRLRLAAKKDAPEIYQKMVRMGLMDLRTGHSGKGVEKMSQNKLTREQKGKAVEIAIQGGDYLEYLKKCGAKNPSAAWWYIKKTLAQSNPKLLEQIPEKSGTVLDENGLAVPLAEVAEKLPPEAVAEVPEKSEKERLYEELGVPAEAVKPEKPNELEGFVPIALSRKEHMKRHMEGHKKSAVITVPLSYDGFTVTCINGKFGEYREESGNFVFRDHVRINYLQMHKEDLAAFVKELQRAGQILGVDC